MPAVKPRTTAILAVLAIALVAALVLLRTATSHSEKTFDLQDAKAQVSILRQPPVGAFAPDPASKRAEPQDSQIPFKLDPAATRVARRGHDGQVLSVEASDQDVCLTDAEPEIGGGACTPISHLIEQGKPIIAWHPVHHESETRVFGLFMDGTTNVTVTSSGQTQSASLVNNTISVTVPTDPSEVAWTDAAGNRHVQQLHAEDPGGPAPPR